MSAKNIWGKVVLYLRENREVALHVACGDITDVELKGNDFIINVNDGMLQNLLIEGKREIERAISWQGLELNVIFNIKKIEKLENNLKTNKKIILKYRKINF